MTDYRRNFLPGGSYFFTACIRGRSDGQGECRGVRGEVMGIASLHPSYMIPVTGIGLIADGGYTI